MEHITKSETYYNAHPRKICWPAIFGGITVAIVTSILLNLLGTGLGFAAFTPDMESVKAIGTSALIWLFVSGIIAMFTAGWVASALSSSSDSVKGYWQGFIVAGISVICMYWIATSAVSSVVSGTFSSLGALRSGVNVEMNNTNNVSQDNQNNNAGLANFSKDNLVQRAKDLLPASMNPIIDQISYEADALGSSLNDQISATLPEVKEGAQNAKQKAEFYKKRVGPALHNFLQSINTENYDQAKKDLIDVISQASGKSTDEINAKIDEWQKAYEDAKAKAKQMAEDAAIKTAEAMSHLAFVNFFLILVSLVSAGIGGICGSRCARRRVETL